MKLPLTLAVLATLSIPTLTFAQISPPKTAPQQFRPTLPPAKPAWTAPSHPAPKPGGTAPARPLGFDPDRVLFDEGDGNLIWAASGTYKIGFTASRVTFVPYLGSTARSWPVGFEVVRVTAGGRELGLTSGKTPQRTGQIVELHRGALRERWILDATQAEQTFALDSLPVRGEIRVEVRVDTGLSVQRDGAAFVFTGPDGGVRHGAAVAIDATGHRIALESQLSGDRIIHVVPESFVAAAVLPLTIDPVISVSNTGGTSTYDFGAPDLAFEASTGNWAFVCERRYSVFDTDVWCELRDPAGQLVPGSGTWINLSTDNWKRPRIAANRAARRYLVVAETHVPYSNLLSVRGRIAEATNLALQPEITISTIAFNPFPNQFHPDVGGDANPSGPALWAVVWEFQHSWIGADADICYRMVRADGSFTTPRGLVLAGATDLETDPRISKTNGSTGPSTQSWMVAFERRVGSNKRIFGATLARDGSVAHPIFAISSPSARDKSEPVVSSPTEPGTGPRRHLVAFRYAYNSTDHDINAVLVENGSAMPETNISVLEGVSNRNMQVQPVVDSDGCRFAVAYGELYPGSTNDFDVFVSTLHIVETLGGPSLALTETRASIARSGAWEGATAIAARYAQGDGRYAIGFEDSRGAQPARAGIAVYEGLAPGGLQRLPHGCHNFPITVTGEPILGTRISFRVPGPPSGTSTSGTLFGLPRSPVIPLPLCAQPCTLGVLAWEALPPLIHIDIPCDGALVGAQAAVQGWDLVGGSCFAAGLRVSDTIVMTVR